MVIQYITIWQINLIFAGYRYTCDHLNTRQWCFCFLKFYDTAIVDEVVNEQPNKQLNADTKTEGIVTDISSDVRQTDTQGKVSRSI